MEIKLEDRIIGTLKNNLEKRSEINIESRLLEDLRVDSLELMMILSGLEDEFSITIAEDDFLDVATVKDIADKMRARGL